MEERGKKKILKMKKREKLVGDDEVWWKLLDPNEDAKEFKYQQKKKKKTKKRIGGHFLVGASIRRVLCRITPCGEFKWYYWWVHYTHIPPGFCPLFLILGLRTNYFGTNLKFSSVENNPQLYAIYTQLLSNAIVLI